MCNEQARESGLFYSLTILSSMICWKNVDKPKEAFMQTLLIPFCTVLIVAFAILFYRWAHPILQDD